MTYTKQSDLTGLKIYWPADEFGNQEFKGQIVGENSQTGNLEVKRISKNGKLGVKGVFPKGEIVGLLNSGEAKLIK